MPRFDLVCLGRAAVDLYCEQIGSTLEGAQTFRKSLGGCAANIAAGSARLGLRVAMLTRVGDEHMGRFVRAALQAEGVDTSAVSTDPERLTGLVLLSIRDRETFPLIFYRERCADMAITQALVPESLIADAGAVLLTGTHLSTPQTAQASAAALRYARAHGAKVILDIDYRPVLWGLTGHDRGEDRFVRSERVTAHLAPFMKDCDLIVGTEEEVHIAGGSTDTVEALKAIRSRSDAIVVLKRGDKGCVILDGPIPESVDQAIVVPGVEVDVLNVLGAGDAFLSGFLSGWLKGAPLSRCGALGNAAGALVVSRHACTPAMPSSAELAHYMGRRDSIPRIDLDPQIARLHEKTTAPRFSEDLFVLAFDHRTQLERLCAEAGQEARRLRELKRLICEGALVAAAKGPKGPRWGAIVDDQWGEEALGRLTGEGWWVARPVETPATFPLSFWPKPSLELQLLKWPSEHVVKCLVHHHPERPQAERDIEVERLLHLQEACSALGRRFLLELLPSVELSGGVIAQAVEPVMRSLYERGVYPDWWKLPSFDADRWPEVEALIEAHDPHCQGILLLGLAAPQDALRAAFSTASARPKARGFAVGRTIFLDPAKRWLSRELSDAQLVEEIAAGFLQTVALWG